MFWTNIFIKKIIFLKIKKIIFSNNSVNYVNMFLTLRLSMR